MWRGPTWSSTPPSSTGWELGKPPSATAIRAALLARVRLTNRASQSHEQAILKHQDVPEAIRMRRPDAAGPAIEQLIGVVRSAITDALRKSRTRCCPPACRKYGRHPPMPPPAINYLPRSGTFAPRTSFLECSASNTRCGPASPLCRSVQRPGAESLPPGFCCRAGSRAVCANRSLNFSALPPVRASAAPLLELSVGSSQRKRSASKETDRIHI